MKTQKNEKHHLRTALLFGAVIGTVALITPFAVSHSAIEANAAGADIRSSAASEENPLLYNQPKIVGSFNSWGNSWEGSSSVPMANKNGIWEGTVEIPCVYSDMLNNNRIQFKVWTGTWDYNWGEYEPD